MNQIFLQLFRYELLGACSSSPCYFGSTCFDQGNDYVCQCPRDYSGKNCDNYTPGSGGGGGGGGSSACMPNPCSQGSTCVIDPQTGSFSCICPFGLTGRTCTTIVMPPNTTPTSFTTYPRSACEPNPCQYGGTCVSFGSGYSCQCLVGFVGMNCEQRQMINLCTSNSCYNGGTCQTQSQQQGQYTVVCYCPPG